MSSNDIVILILAVIALVFGIIDVVRSQGRGLTSWGVVLLAIAVILIDHPVFSK